MEKVPIFWHAGAPPLEMRGVDDPCAALNVTLVTELNPSSLSNLRLLWVFWRKKIYPTSADLSHHVTSALSVHDNDDDDDEWMWVQRMNWSASLRSSLYLGYPFSALILLVGWLANNIRPVKSVAPAGPEGSSLGVTRRRDWQRYPENIQSPKPAAAAAVKLGLFRSYNFRVFAVLHYG